MSNLAAFSYHTIGGYTPVYKRESRNKHAGNVINIGPITIERIVSKTGNEGYRFIGRERKLATLKTLQKVREAINKELREQGVTYETFREDDRKDYQRAYYQTHKQELNAKRNARRRARYAELQALR